MSLRVRNDLNDPVDLKFDAEFDGDGFEVLKRRSDLDMGLFWVKNGQFLGWGFRGFWGFKGELLELKFHGESVGGGFKVLRWFPESEIEIAKKLIFVHFVLYAHRPKISSIS